MQSRLLLLLQLCTHKYLIQAGVNDPFGFFITEFPAITLVTPIKNQN